jgi:two-component system sensor histidine kinase YesM
MAKIKHETEIEKLVLALAKFFRISLHKGDKFISVEEEVELIQHFLDIELIRFPDKFDMKYEIDEAVKKCETLKLILQPIVENAIKHGISQLENKGNITIKAYRSDDDIVYEIIDDGIGFNPQEKLGTPLESGLGGYGLRNVDQRIKLEYGPQYGVHVDSKPQGGTRVKITIANRTSNASL